jgi:MFS family permease
MAGISAARNALIKNPVRRDTEFTQDMTYSSSPADAASPAVHNVFLAMLPITLAVFVGFLTIGLPLPVLPLHLHYTLGMSPLVVGIAIGSQFAAALLSRAWAGNLADTRGAKRAVIAGLLIAAVSGVAYLSSLAFMATPTASLGVLLLGRVLLGCAESLVITGALSWGMGLVGRENAGKVMAWVGIAMYGAYAAGAPAGTLIYGSHGFFGIAVATIVIPLLALGVVAPARPVAVSAARRAPFYKVLGAVFVPGLGLALCSTGLGVITTFIALLFAARNWGSASLAFTAFGAAFIGARLLFAHLPDKIGGARVALVCVLIEAIGQLLIWQADHVLTAYVGAAFTGFGYSLAFPGFGVEAVRRAPPQSRGVAMGAFVAFFDISLGVTGPASGAIASAAGVNAVYLASAVAVMLSTVIALYLMVNPPRPV